MSFAAKKIPITAHKKSRTPIKIEPYSKYISLEKYPSLQNKISFRNGY